MASWDSEWTMAGIGRSVPPQRTPDVTWRFHVPRRATWRATRRQLAFVLAARRREATASSIVGGERMRLDPMQGRWLQMRGVVQRRWTALTPEDLDEVAGMNARLVRKLEERYGCSSDDAERQVREFLQRVGPILDEALTPRAGDDS